MAANRGGRDECLAIPTVLTQSSALTRLGDRPLIVVTASAEADAGWVAAQDNLPPPIHRESERERAPAGRSGPCTEFAANDLKPDLTPPPYPIP